MTLADRLNQLGWSRTPKNADYARLMFELVASMVAELEQLKRDLEALELERAARERRSLERVAPCRTEPLV